MAPSLRVFCLLLICASIVVNVEPRYTDKSSKSVKQTKPTYHSPKSTVHHTHTQKPQKPVYDTTSKPTRHIGDQASQRYTLSGSSGYPTESQTQPPKTGNQVHTYPSSYGKSGGSVTSPPARQHYTQPPYRPPALEPISTQTRDTGTQAIQSNLYSGGSGYPSGTKPPKTGNQVHGYPSSQGISGVGPPVTSPPTGHNLYPQATPKPQASHQYPTNAGLSGGSNTPVQQPALQSSSYPSANGLSGNGHIQQLASGTQLLNNGNQGHGYPNSQGKSGVGSVTSPPTGHNLYPQATPKTQESHQYPTNAGLSGGSNNPVQQPALQSSLYPSANGLSGNGHIQQLASGTQLLNNGNQGHGYPNSQGKSGVGSVTSPPTGHNPLLQPSQKPPVDHSYQTNGSLPGGSNNFSTQQLTSYPTGNGLSGGHILQPGGAGNVYPSNGNKLPSLQTHSYPTSNGQSGGGYKPVPQYPHQGAGSLGYPHSTHFGHFEPSNKHIYIRDHHTTNIHTTNIQTTHIHHYYKPPSHVYYVSHGMQYHYPVYKEELPVYVYEYKSSRSRYRTLLAGLALYNLGHLSKNHESHQYHKQYTPRSNEICKFVVKYDSVRQEEVDIDCRLITDFIWSVHNLKTIPNKKTNLLTVEQILYPNGTLRRPQSILVEGFQVNDALDPRFDGAPLQIQPGMKCYMKYTDGYISVTEKYVNCGLLQTYVKMSFNSASKIAPTILMVATTIALAMLN